MAVQALPRRIACRRHDDDGEREKRGENSLLAAKHRAHAVSIGEEVAKVPELILPRGVRVFGDGAGYDRGGQLWAGDG